MGVLAAGVAVAPQELGDLRLQGDLEEEPDPKPGHLLQDQAQIPAGAEEFIDLGTETLAGRYSS